MGKQRTFQPGVILFLNDPLVQNKCWNCLFTKDLLQRHTHTQTQYHLISHQNKNELTRRIILFLFMNYQNYQYVLNVR